MHQVILPAPPNSPFPSIEVSFAPMQDVCPVVQKRPESNDDNFRPAHLLPPPVFSPKDRLMSKPASGPRLNGPGISTDAFQSLLKSTREAGKPTDLRKEIAVKAQRSKLLERRARFLSKLGAPPSPSAADLPVTPPDSPAVFHYSLPSPGLDSPLIVFERHIRNSMSSKKARDRSGWVEQVDFRAVKQQRPASASKLPSLDEITAHLSSCEKPLSSSLQHDAPRAPLPEFLRSGSPRAKPRPAGLIGPRPVPANIEPSQDSSSTEIQDVESSRIRTGRDMMSTLRRRVQDSEGTDSERQLRRTSAPAELTRSGARAGFQHPVLECHGGF